MTFRGRLAVAVDAARLQRSASRPVGALVTAMRAPTFRARLTIAAAVAVAVAVAAASAVVYVVVRSELRSEVDDGLRSRAQTIVGLPFIRLIETGQRGRFFADIPRPALGAAPGYVQLVSSGGDVARPEEEDVALPISSRVRAVATGTGGTFFADATVAHTHVRIVTTPIREGWALQVARPLSEVDDSLARIRRILLLIAGGGVAIAAALGLLVARAALAPVRRLTAATEHVTETGDLGSRIESNGRDEISRLADSFNTMLAALEESARAQRQLVADASHELRTPLTSLRTNIEVLARDRTMAEGDREQLLHDVVDQLGEMTALVAELVELARGEQQPQEAEDVRLDLLVREAVERAQRNRPQVRFALDARESTVYAVSSALERAVGNLLDNAGKWSPMGGEVEVRVREGEVLVRDHGPGIDEADLPYVFDRFYRAPAARGLPGSGLGLSIVKQVAERHGGGVAAERPEGGGTCVRLTLPPAWDGNPS